MSDIPKVIHYVWVGPKPLSKLTKRCIASWKKYMPDYQIIQWNEENFPDTNHPFYQKMYQQKKWAFVSDYMRFWILSKEGGIYLDTDQEILKPLTPVLNNESVWGRAADGYISCGFIASMPNNSFVEKILKKYSTFLSTVLSEITSPKIVTEIYKELDPIEKENASVLEKQFIYPCNAGEKCTPEKLQHAYTNHHWAESWVPYSRTRKFIRYILLKVGLLKIGKKILKKIKSVNTNQ